LFEEIGFKNDEIEASSQPAQLNPYDHYLRLQALAAFRKTPAFNKLYEVYKRAKGQLKEKISYAFKEELLSEPAEKMLYSHFTATKKQLLHTFDQKDYPHSIELLASFQEPLARLFDEVKILCEDLPTRSNRLILLKEVFALFDPLADLSKIQEHTI
ncbi:MAG: glycine--tRNA ligase, partial [Chlamydiota bacterium]